MSKDVDPEKPPQSDDTRIGSTDDKTEDELSNFEKKMLQHEKDIREGKNESKGSGPAIPTRVKRETTEEEKNPEWKLNPMAIVGIVTILLVLGVILAFSAMSPEEDLSSGSNSANDLLEEDSVDNIDDIETEETTEDAEE